jgi:hypothetical protein
MRSRAWRLLVLVVLLASGAGAAWSSWDRSRAIAQLDRNQRDLSHRVDHLIATLDSVATAEQAYVTSSYDQDPSRIPELIGEVRHESERLRPHLRSLESGRTLQAIVNAAAMLLDVETRAQEHIQLGQDLMATDLIFSEGRSADLAIRSGLRSLRAAENDAYAAARAETIDLSWTIGGVVATAWVLGLILLVRAPAASVRLESAPAPLPVQSTLAISDIVHERSPATHSNLETAADVCTAIGRLTNADDLPQLLQQAARAIDASGVVVWMAAGDELFPAAAFGYPPHVIQKLGPLHRSAINATAAAWRSGTLQIVPGTQNDRGALAAPMLGPDRCIGVLAVEVGIGDDGNPTARAVTTMFAAQLAAALAGWPAASAAAPLAVPPLDRAVEA